MFPHLKARDLDGREVVLPAGLPGEWNVVIVAFSRQQQALADSWVPWLEERATEPPWPRLVELPVIRRAWRPARPVIDGGMAAAIDDRQARQRTLTVYADLRRITIPLGICHQDTVWLFLADRAGRVRWHGSGGWDAATADSLDAALDALSAQAGVAGQPLDPHTGQFEMAFAPQFRCLLAALGITPATAHVTLTPDRLVACFGPWTCRTAPSNVRAVHLTGPYRAYRAIGPRLSLADHGLTFGSTTSGGVCLLLREPVPGIDPLGLVRHPGLTLTVARPERFAAAVRAYAGLTRPGETTSAPGQ